MKTRRNIAKSDDEVKLIELGHFSGGMKELHNHHDMLNIVHNPFVNRQQIYNKRTYKKYSIEKHQCECGSTMVNRKQVIAKHLTTKKHKKYIEN